MIKIVLKYLFITLLPIFSVAQRAKMTPQDYINEYKDDAIKEMFTHGIPASITLAQGMLESNNGNSPLATEANNHFGIKCAKVWEGPAYVQDDDEKNECFRKYASVLDSYNDHSDFLKSRPRYASLFELKITDYKGWAHGLKEAGYATDPKYPQRLIKIIEDYRLYQYDDASAVLANKNQTKKSEATTSASIKPVKTIPKPTSAPVVTIQQKEIRVHNLKYITVKQGDTFYSICRNNNVELEQIMEFNDLQKNYVLKSGEKIYLTHKRKRALEEFHVVLPGETLLSISQLHGIKLKSLCKYNYLNPTDKPTVGGVLNLRYKKAKVK